MYHDVSSMYHYYLHDLQYSICMVYSCGKNMTTVHVLDHYCCRQGDVYGLGQGGVFTEWLPQKMVEVGFEQLVDSKAFSCAS